MQDIHNLAQICRGGQQKFASFRHKFFASQHPRRVIMIYLVQNTGALQFPSDSGVTTASGNYDNSVIGMRARPIKRLRHPQPGGGHHRQHQQPGKKCRPDDQPNGRYAHYPTRPTIKDALVPPNPNELDMALRTSRWRLFSGTKSKPATSSSGSLRFNVGGN